MWDNFDTLIQWVFRGGFIRQFWFFVIIFAALYAVYYLGGWLMQELM